MVFSKQRLLIEFQKRHSRKRVRVRVRFLVFIKCGVTIELVMEGTGLTRKEIEKIKESL